MPSMILFPVLLLCFMPAALGNFHDSKARCADACVRLVPLAQNATKEEIEKFEKSSNNGELCIIKCQEIITPQDLADSVLSKLRDIPFNTIFATQVSEKVVDSVEKLLQRLDERVKKLEASIFGKTTKLLKIPANEGKMTWTTKEILAQPVVAQPNVVLHDGLESGIVPVAPLAPPPSLAIQHDGPGFTLPAPILAQ